MSVRASDLIASTMLALFFTWLVSLRYTIDLATGWPYLLTTSIIFDGVILFLLQNQAKNYRKWDKDRTVFPNPMGGGIVGEYMMRPWHNELDLMGQPKMERWNKQIEKLDRMSRRKTRRMRYLQKTRAK